MTKKRILFILNVDWFFISHRLPIALELIKSGYEVHVAASITDRRTELENLGLIVHHLVMRRGSMNIFDLAHTSLQMYSVIRRVNPEILHLITIKPCLFGGIAARIARVPRVVIAISGLGSVFISQGTKALIRRALAKTLYRLALKQQKLKVIFQNQNDREILQSLVGLADSKIEIIQGSGVDLDQFNITPLGLGAPVVMFASRLICEKGVLEFIEMARHFKAKKPSEMSPRFILVGIPDPENPSSVTPEDITKWSGEGIIEYWGHQTNMPQILSQAHIFAYPSYYGEGLAKVLLEAAACGRAIVTTDHPGCREVVKDGETGILISKKNTEALIAAVENLVKNPKLCSTMGIAGRKLAEQKFSVNSVVSRHLEIYSKMFAVDV